MFKILNPCRSKTWAQLPGDDRSRFCDECGKHVHAIQSYAESERSALSKSAGRLCIYDAGPAPQSASRRLLLRVSLLGALRPLWARTATLRFKVLDITGAPVAGAELRAQRANKSLLAEVKTGPHGDGSLSGLPEGDELEITAHTTGFQTWRKWIRPAVSGDAVIEVVLEIGALLGEVVYVAPVHMEHTQPAPPPPPRKPWWQRLRRLD